MKWDLVLSQIEGNLEVSDFHLTPISNSIPFNKYSQDSLLNYPHYENVRSFYESIKGSFWKKSIDPMFEHDWPIISEKPSDTHCDTFEMGVRRSLYGLYKKQYECLVPVWLEKLDESVSLQFTISLHSAPTPGKVYDAFATRTLDLQVVPGSGQTHQRFVRYFRDYLHHVGIDVGSSDVMDVRFDTKTAWLWGLEVSSGNVVQKNVSELASNLIVRERPLLEFNDMILNTLSNNKVITKQLFNFNLCFNLEDILSPQLCSMIYGNKISISVRVSTQPTQPVDGKIPDSTWLEMMDFSSNHEFLACPRLGFTNIPELYGGPLDGHNMSEEWRDVPNKPSSPETAEVNALNYLHDNLFKDFTTTDKYCPEIIHWSVGNGDIFNTYNGLGGYIVDGNEIIHLPHINGTTPITGDVKNKKNSGGNPIPTNINWCTCVELSWAVIYMLGSLGKIWWEGSVQTMNQILYKYASNFRNEWVEGLHYKNPFITQTGPQADLKVILIHAVGSKTGNNNMSYIPSRMGYFMTSDSDFGTWNAYNTYSDAKNGDQANLTWMRDPSELNLIYLISEDLDNLTFWNVRRVLNDQIWSQDGNENKYFKKSGGLIENFSNVLNSVQEQHVISFNKSITPVRCDSPSLSSQEIEYYKNNLSSPEECYVIRYDGKISPRFVSTSPTIYYKDEVKSGELKKSSYAKYVRSRYTPIFPSIDYCALRSGSISYEEPMVQHKFIGDYNPMFDAIEYKWYNTGSLVALPISLELMLTSKKVNGKYETIENLVVEWIGDNLFKNYEPIVYESNTQASKEELARWALDQYDLSSSFEYDYDKVTSENPQAWLDGYKYNVKLILK